jgi:hypothetical protein
MLHASISVDIYTALTLGASLNDPHGSIEHHFLKE